MNNYQAQRGQALPIMVFLLVALLSFAALAVDAGYWRYDQRIQQTAADSGAIAGAEEVAYANGSPAPVVTAAQNGTATNGFTNGSKGVVVTVNNPPASGPYTGNDTAVEVIVTQQNKTFFANVLQNFSSVTVGARAVAARTGGGNNAGCFYDTNSSSYLSLSGTTINAAGCDINLAGSFSAAGATINAAQINYAGSAPSVAGGSINPAPTHVSSVPDPCSEIVGCAYLKSNPPPVSACTTISQAGGSKTITPGCYSNISLAGVTTTFNPGLYVITGPISISGSTVTGSNVTFYIANGGGPVSMAGPTVTLSAPTSGNYAEYGTGEANVLFYQIASNTNSVSVAGSNSSLSGLQYFPGATSLSTAGGGAGYTVIVTGASSVSWAGTTNTFASPPPGGSIIQTVRLVE